MSKKERAGILFLEDILYAIEKIERYTEDLPFEKLCENETESGNHWRSFKKCSGESKTQIYFCGMERGNRFQECSDSQLFWY